MNTCKDELSETEILEFLIHLWRALKDVENRSIVKWVNGGRVFKIVDGGRFFFEVCPELCDECTPAYFEYFLICCGFEAIPPRFVDFYHPDFLKHDYSRIGRVRAECTILTPKAFKRVLEANSDLLTGGFHGKRFANFIGSLGNESATDKADNKEAWPDPEELPESPLTPEATTSSSDSSFMLNAFSSDMIDPDSNISIANSFPFESASCSESSDIEKPIPKTVQSALPLDDLKSSLKLNLIHCLSIESEHTDDLSSTLVSHSNSFETNNLDTSFESSSNGFSKPLDEKDSDSSSPSPPESLSSPNVSPIGISKPRDFSLIFDPSDPFNHFYNKPILPESRTWSTPFTPSLLSFPSLDPDSCQPSTDGPTDS